MKRGRFKQKTYEEAVARRTALHERRRTLAVNRRTPMKRSQRDPEHDAWREAVLERDGYRCRWIDPITKQRCTRRGKSLHAHHIRERTQRPDLRHDVTNGATLCGEHHDRLHHTVEGRQWGREIGLLGGETYELARKNAVQ
jgi:hypothetical protein